MKKHLAGLLVLGALMLLVLAAPALAHEPREIGPYDVEFGWHSEPAYAGVANAAELFIHDKTTQKGVEGADATLKLDISFGDKTKTLELQPVEGDPGHYLATVVPTRPGDYSFHITGKIGDTAVDETFTSADGKFDSVAPGSDAMFPDTATLTDLQAQIDDLKAQVEALKSK